MKPQKTFVIQEEVSISQKEIDYIIKHYDGVPDNFGMGINGMMLDKEGIINEIRKMSETGKAILMMKYRFYKWKESRKAKKRDKK